MADEHTTDRDFMLALLKWRALSGEKREAVIRTMQREYAITGWSEAVALLIAASPEAAGL